MGSPVRVWSEALYFLSITIIYSIGILNFMQQIHNRPLKHILVCTNEREQEKECCSHVQGYEIFRELKDWVKLNGLSSKIWITRTGCLGFCNNTGATIVIYPEQLWFKEVRKEETQKIKDFILDAIK